MIIDSKNSIHDFFDGYAFSNTDLIIGNEGFWEFLKENDAGKLFDADGSYIKGTWISASAFEIEADYRGFQPIYYFCSDRNWYVSDSFYDLVYYLKYSGHRLQANDFLLEQWRCNVSLAEQLVSHKTVISGINCLSSDEYIRIENGIFRIKKKSRTFAATTYKEALGYLVALWLGRVKTLLQDGNTAVRLNLSGGLDSRVIFSLLKKAASVSGVSRPNISIGSNPKKEEDFSVAKHITQVSGFKLHQNPGNIKDPKITALASFDAWKRFTLGRYSLIYFSLTGLSGNVVFLAGEGGEAFRNFYPAANFQKYVNGFKKNFTSNSLFSSWRQEVLSAVDEASTKYPDTKDNGPIAHYREHRARHHHSKNPKNSINASFFGSKAFFQLAFLAPKQYLQEAQLLYDVMYSLDRELPFMEYDTPSKAPNQNNITHLCDGFAGVATPGRVYRKNAHQEDAQAAEHPNQLLINESLSRMLLHSDAFSKSEREQYYSRMKEIESKGTNRNLSKDGAFMHFILTKCMVADVT